jgi:hypothetical protein
MQGLRDRSSIAALSSQKLLNSASKLWAIFLLGNKPMLSDVLTTQLISNMRKCYPTTNVGSPMHVDKIYATTVVAMLYVFKNLLF